MNPVAEAEAGGCDGESSINELKTFTVTVLSNTRWTCGPEDAGLSFCI